MYVLCTVTFICCSSLLYFLISWPSLCRCVLYSTPTIIVKAFFTFFFLLSIQKNSHCSICLPYPACIIFYCYGKPNRKMVFQLCCQLFIVSDDFRLLHQFMSISPCLFGSDLRIRIWFFQVAFSLCCLWRTWLSNLYYKLIN